MSQNNSAHRLSEILERAINLEGSQNILSVLQKSMEATDNPYPIVDFFVLIADVEQSTSYLKNIRKKNEYLGAINELKGLFSSYEVRNVDHWNLIKNEIRSKRLALIIDACGNFLSQEFPVTHLDEDEIKKYLSECEELLQEVTGSDLSDNLKTFLVIRLEEICTALRHYSIGGSERLQKIVEANIGGMILQSVNMKDKDKGNGLLKKLFSWFITVGALLGMYNDVQTLLQLQSQPVTEFFLPSGK
jgi:hypothetical protein